MRNDTCVILLFLNKKEIMKRSKQYFINNVEVSHDEWVDMFLKSEQDNENNDIRNMTIEFRNEMYSYVIDDNLPFDYNHNACSNPEYKVTYTC